VTIPPAPLEAPVRLVRREFSAIPGWQADDRVLAYDAFRRSAREIMDTGSAFARAVQFGGSRENWRPVCEAALSGSDPERFFDEWFVSFAVEDAQRPQGLFTGYFEPEVRGSRTRDPRFPVPLYRVPADLVSFDPDEQKRTGFTYGRRVNGQPQPYFTRAEIESGALDNQQLELVWLASWADAFFIHVQGSGRVRFADESVQRLSFAAKSGRPYTSIGSLLVDRGLIAREDMSMQAIRNWMNSHPDESRRLMWENQSFIFFREADLPDAALGAYGAQHVQLTPRRSIAVDRAVWMFGTPVWLDCSVPAHAAAPGGKLRSLMIAQDTGSAIIGGARADVFWGFGDDAGEIAGRMKGTGSMTVLLPHAVAAELGLT
jgi:membrane-bound lytic murein transglycosylase A